MLLLLLFVNQAVEFPTLPPHFYESLTAFPFLATKLGANELMKLMTDSLSPASELGMIDCCFSLGIFFPFFPRYCGGLFLSSSFPCDSSK